MTRGELVIIAATILVVLAVFLWIAVVKIEGIEVGGYGVMGSHYEATKWAWGERGRHANTGTLHIGAWSRQGRRMQPSPGTDAHAGQPPISLQAVAVPLAEGLRFENRTGRAARGGVSGTASARRLPRGADAKLAQARLVRLRVTAYCPCARCCGKWADGITASGTRADHPLVAAPPEFPFGTVMTVPGYGTVKVEDRGGAIKGDRLDVFFPTHEEALEWGVQWLDVKIVGH